MTVAQLHTPRVQARPGCAAWAQISNRAPVSAPSITSARSESSTVGTTYTRLTDCGARIGALLEGRPPLLQFVDPALECGVRRAGGRQFLGQRTDRPGGGQGVEPAPDQPILGGDPAESGGDHRR